MKDLIPRKVRTFLVRNVIFVGITSVTLLTMGIAITFYYQRSYVDISRRMAQHSYEIRGHVQTLYTKVKELESAEDAYILTGNRHFIEPFPALISQKDDSSSDHDNWLTQSSFLQEVKVLRNLTADNPTQIANIDSLELYLRERLVYAQSLFLLYDEKGEEAAEEKIKTEEGHRISERIHQVALNMIAEEYGLFLERQKAEEAHTYKSKLLMRSGMLLFYVGWLAMVWLTGSYRKRRFLAESTLQEHDILLKAIMDGGNHAIFATDRDGTITSFNRATERLLGYPASYFVGKKAASLMTEVFDRMQLQRRAKRLSQKFGRPITGIEIFLLPLEDEGIFEQEWMVLHRDGKQIPISLTVTALRDRTGAIHGYLGIAQDITERKGVERTKNEFISTVSHELRTPLTSIRGALGLVAGGAMGSLPEKAAELVTIAHKNSERLVLIINDILDIEKIESGKMQMYIKPIEVAETLKQTLEANRAYGEKYGVVFILRKVPEQTWVAADPDRLMQVMANLLSNAAKFSPPGSEVWIGAECRDNRIYFSVQDFGPGIPGSFRSQIFEKFAQADHSDTRRYEGTGLGLSITQKLVEAMHGSIGFTTEIGEGTTFFFDLPRMELAGVEDVSGKLGNSSTSVPPILICEDDKDVAALLRLLLAKAGYDAELTYTLAEAREKLRQNSYVAMTLDLQLPDGKGMDFLRELRTNAATLDLPVVVVSATAEDSKGELNGEAIGVIDWIAKPIEEVRLVQALQHAVSSITNGRPCILHVEDDSDLVEIIARSLHGRAELIVAPTIREAEEQLKSTHFDLLVLDLALPDGSGLDLLERLNLLAGYPLPVLILSASEPDEGVSGKVEAALVKSRMSEARIVETILSLVHRENQIPGEKP